MKRLAAVLLLLATVITLYRKAIRLWWMYDDAWLLHVALARRWTMTFTDGDTWHRTFTPLLDSTFEILIVGLGLDPGSWHAVLLGLIAACAAAIYCTLRLYLPVIPALAGAFLFVTGAPICSMATRLMFLHYLEALLLATLSAGLFVLAARRGSNVLNLLSALAYFAAMLAEDIVAPLPLLLLLLPERTRSIRARHLLIHVLAFVGYMGWRRAVLGMFFEIQGWAIAAEDVPLMLATLPWRVMVAWSGSALEVGLVALAIIGIGAALSLHSRSAAGIALMGLILAVEPLLPASKEIHAGLLIAPWLWLCVLFAFGVARLSAVRGNALVLAAAATLMIANRQEWAVEFARSERMSDEGRAFMELDGTSLLRLPSIPPPTMVELRWLKEEHLRRSRGSGWFYDDLYLCSGSVSNHRVFEYQTRKRDVVEVTARIPDLARAYCSSIRENAPLRAEFRHRRESLFWRFGPYSEGRWRVVLAGGLQAFDVPREDGFRLQGVPGLSLRVRYQSPEGWVTYTPELTLEFAKQPELIWAR